MSGPTRQDRVVYEGGDYSILLTILEADGVTPLDLSGCSIAWEVSSGPGQEPIIAKSSDDAAEILVTSEAEGAATVFVDATDLEGYGNRTYNEKVVVTDAAGDSALVMRGLFTIVKT